MEVQKIGPNSVVFKVDMKTLRTQNGAVEKEPYDEAALKKIAREALLTEGISADGSLELEAFTIGTEAIVFAITSNGFEVKELFGFSKIDDVMNAVDEINHLSKPPNASLIYHNNTYYLAFPSDVSPTAISLLSEYALITVQDSSECMHIMTQGKHLIACKTFQTLTGKK